jgi:hypothetical protein
MPTGALLTSALGTFATMGAVWKDIKSYKVNQLFSMSMNQLFSMSRPCEKTNMINLTR